MYSFQEETPKYKKKSKKQGKKRSDHKHIYKYVRIVIPSKQFNNYIRGVAKVCTKCGYVNDVYFMWSKDDKITKIWEECNEVEYMCDITTKYIDLNHPFIKQNA